MPESRVTTKTAGPFTWELRKPHAGLVQFCIVFPDGDYYVWREVEYHSQAKIAANQSTGVPAVPAGWRIGERGQATIPDTESSVTVVHSLGAVPSRVVASEGVATADSSTATITVDRSPTYDGQGNLIPPEAIVVDYMLEVEA